MGMKRLFYNFPLAAALISIVLAQFIKVPIQWIARGRWTPRMGFSTGGMPSSHSAAVSALTAAIGISEGWSSSAFAVAFVLSAITMYDAMGIRRHAGTHATFLNQLLRSQADVKRAHEGRAEFKELLGHRPTEVLAGAIFGIAVSTAIHLMGSFQ
jgi:acid phosphatase family membrane protein YuiD